MIFVYDPVNVSENKGASIIKKFRRGIIIVCGIMTFLWVSVLLLNSLPVDSYGFGVTQKDIDNIAVTKINVNQKAKIDKRTVVVRKITIDKDRNIHTEFRSVSFSPGWSFGWRVFRLYDDRGKEYKSDSVRSSGKVWGENAYISYKGPLDQDAKELILEYAHYNRHMKFVVPIGKAGGQNE